MSSPAYPPSDPALKRREYAAVLGLLVVVAVIFGPTTHYPFANLEDPGYVSGNPHVLAGLTWEGLTWAFTTFQQSDWQPLTWLSLMLDAHFYGNISGGYHLTNLLLHAANVLLLFYWLRSVTKAYWRPLAVAFFFAAHPTHVESVAWVSERKDLLGTLFFLLTLRAYTRYAWGGLGRMRYFWLALGLFGLGLMARPTLVTLPPLLLLLDHWPLRRFPAAALSEHWRRLVVEKLPFVVLMVSSCLATSLAQSTPEAMADNVPFPSRLASVALGGCTYLAETFWPVNLGLSHPGWYKAPWWQPTLAALGLAALTAVTLWRWRRRPYLAVGWLWFLGTLVPIIGLVQMSPQTVAARPLYLPNIGLFIVLCWGAQDLVRRWPRARVSVVGAGMLAGAACLALSVRQVSFWRDPAVLSQRAIELPRPPLEVAVSLADVDQGQVAAPGDQLR